MKKKRDILPFLPIACAVAIIGMMLALVLGSNEAAEFTPPPFEETAAPGVPDVPEDLGYTAPYTEGMGYRFALCGNVCMDGTAALVYFTNPAENDVWLKLRVLDEGGNTLGETGIICPGEYVKAVTLDRALDAGTPISLKIMGYEPKTYYSAGAAVMNTVTGDPLQ